MVRFANLARTARLERPLIALVAVVVLAIGALTIRASIAVDATRDEVEDCLSALVGGRLRIIGSATSRLLPWPGIHFDEATLVRADDGATLARMEAVDVSLDVAALLLGRPRPQEIRLTRPEIRFAVADPRTSVTAAAAYLDRLKPTTVVIEKGRVVADTPLGEEILDGLEASIAWPRPSANATLRAAFVWRGEATTLDLETPSPELLVASDRAAAALRLTSPFLRLAFSGDAGLTPAPRIVGTGEIELVDAARFARWAGLPRTADVLAGRWRIEGDASADARGVAFSNARVDLAGNKGQGALTWRWDLPRPRLGGTIAFSDIDLSNERRRPFGPGWRALALDRAGFGPDFDLRLSSPSLVAAGVTLTRVAASLLVGEGRLHAEIGTAQFFGKTVSLMARGTLEADGLKAQIRGSGDDLPIADLAALAAIPGVEGGRAAVAFEAETRCGVLGACLAAVGGRLRVGVEAATVTGASPFADISRFHPIVPKPTRAAVTTTWDRADADLRFTGSHVDVDKVEVVGKSARFTFSGRGDLATGAVDLLGNAYFPAFRPDPTRNGTTDVIVPMRLGGTLRRLEATARGQPAPAKPLAAPDPSARPTTP